LKMVSLDNIKYILELLDGSKFDTLLFVDLMLVDLFRLGSILIDIK
jgi:hypothetical protein